MGEAEGEVEAAQIIGITVSLPTDVGVWDASNCDKHPTLTSRLTKTP